MDAPVDALQLSARSYNCLKRAGIVTIGQLITLSDQRLLCIGNLGVVSLNEIRCKLSGYLGEHRIEGPDSALPPANSLARELTPISALGLSARTQNALWRAGVTSVEELAALPTGRIKGLRNVGVRSAEEIRVRLEACLAEYPLPVPARGRSHDANLPLVPTPAEAPAEPSRSSPTPPETLAEAELLEAARAARVPLDTVSTERLFLPPDVNRQLLEARVITIGQLAMCARSDRTALPLAEEHLRRYLVWLIQQNKPTLDREVEGAGLNPLGLSLLAGESLRAWVAGWLGCLDRKMKRVIRWRYGLDGPDMTLAEVGECLGKTRETARQQEKRALQKLGRTRVWRHRFLPLDVYFRDLVRSAGGLLAESSMAEALSRLMDTSGINPQGAVRLLLTVRSGPLVRIRKLRAWGLADLPLGAVGSICENVAKVLAAEGAPLSVEDLLIRLLALPWYQLHARGANDRFILACAATDPRIVERADGMIGLRKWERRSRVGVDASPGRPTHAG